MNSRYKTPRYNHLMDKNWVFLESIFKYSTDRTDKCNCRSKRNFADAKGSLFKNLKKDPGFTYIRLRYNEFPGKLKTVECTGC